MRIVAVKLIWLLHFSCVLKLFLLVSLLFLLLYIKCYNKSMETILYLRSMPIQKNNCTSIERLDYEALSTLHSKETNTSECLIESARLRMFYKIVTFVWGLRQKLYSRIYFYYEYYKRNTKLNRLCQFLINANRFDKRCKLKTDGFW